MTIHIENIITNTGKKYLRLVALIAIASTGGSTVLGCSGDSTEDSVENEVNAEDSGVGSEEDEIVKDCEPSDWVDPGTVPNPEVVKVDPTAGILGQPWGWTPPEALAEFDYVEEEFLIKNTSPAPYTSRILVRRPKDPAKFTGTVFMEWYNVSGGIDFDPLWNYSWEYFMREGHVEVSVSAQAVGANSLITNDPERYAEISHPGDGVAAQAIFSQAAMAIRSQSELILGECMPVDAVIGMGQSQSGMMLGLYINTAGPVDKMYDGYIDHTGMEPGSNNPHAPTFVVFSMTEGNGALEDGPNLVEWVVAGATHTDEFTVTRGSRAAVDLGMDPASMACALPMNQFPSYRVYNAVCDWIHRWVREGKRPPSFPRLEGEGGGMMSMFLGGGSSFDTDEYGNVLGGVRLPELEVPIAVYTTTNGPGEGSDIIAMMACGLGGATDKFSEEKLLELYPTHDDYVEKYTAATEKAVADGILLEEDAEDAIEEAENAPIPN